MAMLRQPGGTEITLTKRSASTALRIDGRRLRSARTKQLIIEAYLALAREKSPQIPTAAQIADRAGYSVRSVFERFPDIHSLQLAAVDHALSLLAVPPPPAAGDRLTRIRAHVELRAAVCDRWLPLWRSLVVNQSTSPELRQHVVKLRERAIERLEQMYAPELSTVPAVERRHLLIVLEALLDAESWARMQEFFGLSYDEACAAWTQAIDRLLPPTPLAA
jgi:AcrR family transcriptional regulator